ncbi:hypothetical protein CCR75_005504 [Bremia lactucae]|uniref:Uncharacterized protein n=1 Tax=Bremia lactucae TaxID=4779 RepID=A0A976IJD3_BRELC|nr:hypothetical protein CCR75_005504 [Bremia lactucae]
MLSSKFSRTRLRCQSQRQFWGHPSNFLAWVGFNNRTNSCPSLVPSSSSKDELPAITPSLPQALPLTNHLAAKCNVRPSLPADVAVPKLQKLVDDCKRKSAAQALDRLLHKIRHVPFLTQLLDAWLVVSQCRPFVVETDMSFRVRLATAEDVTTEKPPRLFQIVPANIFAQLSSKIPARSMFVGSTSIQNSDNAAVVVGNDAHVMSFFIQSLHRMNEHKLVVTFFEAYDRDRILWLQEHRLREAANDYSTDGQGTDDSISELNKKFTPSLKALELPRVAHSCYIQSLAALKHQKKILRLFDNENYQLNKMCRTTLNLSVLLHACHSERNGELARKAIDTITIQSPLAVIPLSCYELAIRANLLDRKHHERELLAAVHLAKALHNDGGYLLKPDIWSGLIKVSLKRNRPDLALEIFKSYPNHRISEHQTNFRQVLRVACRTPDRTALEMMQFCWAPYINDLANKAIMLERKAYQDAISLKNLNAKELLLGDIALITSIPAWKNNVEADLLNMMLWEMLKHSHAMPSIVEVLNVMETTRSKGRTAVLRSVVVAQIDHDMAQNEILSRTAVERSLEFWKEHPSVLDSPGFLVRLLLDKCLEHRWDDECEFLVDYMLELGLYRIPFITIIKMMKDFENRGRFEANARIGQKLLQRLSETNRQKLYDRFLRVLSDELLSPRAIRQS